MPKPRKDITGKTFGYWTVLEFLGHSFWLCECVCGARLRRRAPHLKTGHSKSCGCMKSALISERLREDLTGRKFGRLTVLHLLGQRPQGDQNWLCRCVCGETKEVITGKLKSGYVQSCGCLQKERTTTHGLTNSPTYIVWNKMKARCDNPRQAGYERYGGRGIKYVRRWAKFDNFLKDMGVRPEGYSLDRIDPNKGYGPKNCRWIPKAEQAKNTRRTKVVMLDGKEMILADAIEKLRREARWKHARV